MQQQDILQQQHFREPESFVLPHSYPPLQKTSTNSNQIVDCLFLHLSSLTCILAPPGAATL